VNLDTREVSMGQWGRLESTPHDLSLTVNATVRLTALLRGCAAISCILKTQLANSGVLPMI